MVQVFDNKDMNASAERYLWLQSSERYHTQTALEVYNAIQTEFYK